MTDEQHLDLAELCRLADVTPRTVRFYIAQGLLPGPSGRGPASRYSAAHLQRLRLIKRLQQQYLPLAKIRRALDQFDVETSGMSASSAAALPSSAAPGAPPAPGASTSEAPAPAGASALDYIRSVLAPPSVESVACKAVDALPTDAADLGPAPPAAQAPDERESVGRRAASAPAASRLQLSWQRPSRSQWERISLSPDVELHIRRPLSPKDHKTVARLTRFAADLFEEGSS